jgi:hypothetical protein
LIFSKVTNETNFGVCELEQLVFHMEDAENKWRESVSRGEDGKPMVVLTQEGKKNSPGQAMN